RWSALAPDFAEVEENVEYEEAEDEFDIHPEEERRQQMLDGENEPVDVRTVETKGVGEDSWRMPVLLDLGDAESEDEFVMVGTGTMRRKSPAAGGKKEEAALTPREEELLYGTDRETLAPAKKVKTGRAKKVVKGSA
ncbi:hypothetical protein V491_03936, partial [Pseudogymnoascus sp. VKM F-3775]